MAARELDDTFGKTNAYTLRWFYLYLIKEYARHLRPRGPAARADRRGGGRIARRVLRGLFRVASPPK